MAKEISKTIPEKLLNYLTGEQLVTVVTQNHDGTLMANAISWCIAKDSKTVRLAVDQQSYIMTNIQANPTILITIYGPDSVYSIAGKAMVLKETIEDVEFQASSIEIAVTQVRDIIFYGGKLTETLKFRKGHIYHPTLLDEKIYNELKR